MAEPITADQTPCNNEGAGNEVEKKGVKRSTDGEECLDQKIVGAIAIKKQRMKNKNVDPNILKVRRIIQQCCSSNDLATAMEAYQAAISENVRIEAQTFYNLLNLCDGIGERGIHIGTPKPKEINQNDGDMSDKPREIREVDVPTRKNHAFVLKQRMDELKIALNETAFSALVKILARAKEFGEAENVLLEAEKVQQCRPRLRLYSSLLTAYCEAGEMVPALQLWSRIFEHNIALSEREYLALMRCACNVGKAAVMERVLTEIAEDILIPSHDTLNAIVSWFQSENAVVSTAVGTSAESSSLAEQGLPVSDAPSMGPVQCATGCDWEISNTCSIDSKTGVLLSGCLQGCKLNPVTVSIKIWEEMKEMNETIVLSGKMEQDMSEYQGGRKGSKRKLDQSDLDKRKSHWTTFGNYLEQRRRPNAIGPQLDVVIDGANVGYFEQNFSGAPKHVDYNQINWIVQNFLSNGKSVLLILHERHFNHNLMPKWALPIVASWDQAGLLYRTPTGMNDDWFWLHAALWSGRDTLVLTNDEMRDHHFQMLAPRSFLRWKDRHQVHFKFGNWEKGPKQRQVHLTYPDVYSRRIQRVEDGLVVPLAKCGDEHRFLDGSHVATENEPEEETYLCIRPRRLAL